MVHEVPLIVHEVPDGKPGYLREQEVFGEIMEVPDLLIMEVPDRMLATSSDD